MSITLTSGGVTLTLPADLDWTDEYAWSPVQQDSEYSITGALLLDAAPKLAGRPIELVGSERSAWITRAQLDALEAWRAVPGLEMTLVLRGTARTVVWDHQRGAIDARPILDVSDPSDTDPYRATLRLLET